MALLLGACSADGDESAVSPETSPATAAGQTPEASPDPSSAANRPTATAATGPTAGTATPSTDDRQGSAGPVPAQPVVPSSPTLSPGTGGDETDDASGEQLRTADGRAASAAPSGIISSCALGPLVVGMNAERAGRTGLLDGDAASGFVFKASPDVFIAGTDADGIVGFLVKDQGWRTPQGITTGVSTQEDLQQAYGAQLQSLTTPEGYPYFLVRDGDCGFFFAPDSFGPDDGPVAVIISGLWDAVSQARPNTSFG